MRSSAHVASRTVDEALPLHAIAHAPVRHAVERAHVALGPDRSVLILLPLLAFSRPTGPYAIGTVTYHWVDVGVDVDRREVFSADPDQRPELMVQIWYPALDVPSSPRAPYLQEPSP